MDSLENIVKLITAYPKFKPVYKDVYQFCLNTKKIMNIFAKKLQILDENTVHYMIDEMQDIINECAGNDR